MSSSDGTRATDADATGAITALLRAAGAGDRSALNALFESVYGELRRLARRQLKSGQRSPTLDTTALVHEAFLKLAGGQVLTLRDRRHFFATASRAMRMVLIDRARRRRRQKRGAGEVPLPLDEARVGEPEQAENLLALDGALTRLEAEDPELAQIVSWRFFAGLSMDEIAGLMEVSERTVKRHWRSARAFLYQELAKAGWTS